MKYDPQITNGVFLHILSLKEFYVFQYLNLTAEITINERTGSTTFPRRIYFVIFIIY